MNDDGETREQRYERQTTEQFALLGRFVQSFELMVHAARSGSIQLTSANRDIQVLMNRVFHHHALGALALFEIWREIITAMVVELRPALEKDQRETTLAILKQIASDYQRLAARRNDLLHGTWLIGWAGSGQADFSDLRVIKSKWKATGESKGPPIEDADELRTLTTDCAVVAELIQRLTLVILMTDGPKVGPNFEKVDGKWVIPGRSA